MTKDQFFTRLEKLGDNKLTDEERDVLEEIYQLCLRRVADDLQKMFEGREW